MRPAISSSHPIDREAVPMRERPTVGRRRRDHRGSSRISGARRDRRHLTGRFRTGRRLEIRLAWLADFSDPDRHGLGLHDPHGLRRPALLPGEDSTPPTSRWPASRWLKSPLNPRPRLRWRANPQLEAVAPAVEVATAAAVAGVVAAAQPEEAIEAEVAAPVVEAAVVEAAEPARGSRRGRYRRRRAA